MNQITTPAQASAEWVAERLRDMIVKGDLPSGSRLVERKLSADLNVSRTPVREALKLLRADGLVEISLHRGAQVVAYTEQEALDLFDVIAVIEGLAAERLAERMTARVMDRLEALHETLRREFAARDLTAYFDTNSAVHDTIIHEAGNPILAESHRRIMLRARRGRFMAIIDSDRWRQAMDEHESAMTAFRARDSAAAAAIWSRHLRHTGATVAAVLRASQR